MLSDANNEREARQLKLEPAKWSHVWLGSDFRPRLVNPGTPDRRLYSETSYEFDIQDDDIKGAGRAPPRSLFEILNISEGQLYGCSEDELAEDYWGHPERPLPSFGIRRRPDQRSKNDGVGEGYDQFSQIRSRYYSLARRDGTSQ